MSIEQLLKENTAALNALAAALKEWGNTTVFASIPERREAKKEAPPATVVKPEEKPAVAPEAKPEPKPETVATYTAPDYDAASKAVMSVVKSVSKQAAIDLLAEFGAKTAKEVPVERFAELIAKAQELQGAAQ